MAGNPAPVRPPTEVDSLMPSAPSRTVVPNGQADQVSTGTCYGTQAIATLPKALHILSAWRKQDQWGVPHEAAYRFVNYMGAHLTVYQPKSDSLSGCNPWRPYEQLIYSYDSCVWKLARRCTRLSSPLSIMQAADQLAASL